MFIIISVSVLLALVILDYLHRKSVYKSALLLPNVDFYTFPFIGQAHSFLGNGQARMSNFQNIARQTSKLGGIARIWFGTRLFLTITDPDVAEMVLTTFLEKDELMDIIHDLSGTGSIFAPVTIWRPRRKMLVPAFSPRNLKNFVDVFDEASRDLVKQLEQASSGGPFSVFPYLSKCTMKSVCESNLGVKVSLENKQIQQFIKTFDKVLKQLSIRLTQPLLNSVYKFLPRYKVFRDDTQILFNFVDQVIQSRKKKKEQDLETINKSDCDYIPESAKPVCRSFLDMLLDYSKPNGLTDTELRDECIVITIAGTDTSAVCASFTLCMLARYPHVQDRLYEEIIGVFENSERPVNPEDLQKLPYLDAVLKETLRLYPPVPVIVRRVDKNVSIKSGETLVPGMGILIQIWGIHRNPKYWGPEADLFRPDRFINSPLPHPVAFLPFSQGPRNCLGYQYAMMSMKTTLVTLLRKFRVLPMMSDQDTSAPGFNNSSINEEPMRVQFDVLMKDVDQFTIQLEARK